MKYHLAFTANAVVLLIIYAVFIRQYDNITTIQACYGVLIVLLGTIPAIIAYFGRSNVDLLPLMPLHGLFYAVAFGLPVFSNKTVWLAKDEDAINNALVLTILGLLCLYLGYYAFRSIFGRLRSITFLRGIPIPLQVRVAWFLFGFYMLFKIIPTLNEVPSLEQLSKPLGYLSLGILIALAFDNLLPRKHVFVLIVAISFNVLTMIVSGVLADLAFFLVLIGIIYWNKKQKVPWHFILLLTLIVIVLNPVKAKYREHTWRPQEGSLSYYDKALIYLRAFQDYYSTDNVFTIVSEDERTVNRLAHISTFSYVIAMTPDRVPYWMGGSYKTLWTSYIPRALWPEKPRATIGQDFGHRYRLLGISDTATSFNLPWLPEFYANFGVPGVLIGMFLVGVLFRILVQKFSVPASATLEHILGITITFSLFYAESNFSLMVGGILTTYLTLIVILRVLVGMSRTPLIETDKT